MNQVFIVFKVFANLTEEVHCVCKTVEKAIEESDKLTLSSVTCFGRYCQYDVK